MPGTTIRKYREMKKFTQEYVAEKMGISQNAYSKIENNITQLTVNHLKKLSEILEISINELMRDEYEIHRPLSMQAQSVSKEALLMTLENLREKIESKSFGKHEFFPVVMALFQTADGILSNIND